MRLRKRAAGLLVGAAVLFVIGTNVQAGMLFVLAALLLGAVAAGALLPFAALRGLEAELVAPEEAAQGSEALVELRLTNRARGVRWGVLTGDAHLETVEVFLPSVKPGERVEVATVRTPSRRGFVSTERVTIRSAAPFGVAERRRRIAVMARTLVLPAVEPIGPLPFVEPVATTEVGYHTAPRRGQGPEYLGVREYRMGDPMRRVHWGLTARHGQVMVRELEEERTRRLAILVDTERDTGTEWTPLDRVCTVAASILTSALAHGHGARLAGAVLGGEVELVGRGDERDLLRWLALRESTGMGLTEVLARLGTVEFRGVETLVVPFPAWGDRDLVGLAASLAAVPVARVVVVPIAIDDEDVPDDALAVLREAGLDVRPWRPGTPLGRALGAAVEVGV